MTNLPVTTLGQTVAAVLAGAWRETPPACGLSAAELEAVAPLLMEGGTAGLTWHCLRRTTLRTSPPAREFRQHYRLQTLRAVEREAAIPVLLARLRAAGVEPLLVKGWSCARLYPELGLRPSRDVDLCVAADRLETATAVLSAAPLPCPVDLHREVPDLPDRPWRELFRRSRLLPLGETAVRVLGPEDQLRLLCLHLTRHGIGRPVWLCDIGACLESIPTDFDWDRFWWGSKHRAGWAACVLRLAQRLLGARLDPRTTAGAETEEGVPAWVEDAVLWCWGTQPGRLPVQYLRRPREFVHCLRLHGLGRHFGSQAIKASLDLGLAPTHAVPLLLAQLARFVRRKVPHVVDRLLRPRRHFAAPLTIHDD